jgi:hypothetical protein
MYLREDGSPYYIGKGKDKRAWKKNKKEAIKPPKDQSKIKILSHRLSEYEAFLLEIKLISIYGRKDLNTGVLRNRTDGGDGSSGAILSEEHIKNWSEAGVESRRTNRLKDEPILTWYHDDGRIENCKYTELREKYELSKSLRKVISGDYKSYHGWRLSKTKTTNTGSKNSRHDPTIYPFVHDTGAVEYLTIYDLGQKYNIPNSKLHRIKHSDLASRGWRIQR